MIVFAFIVLACMLSVPLLGILKNGIRNRSVHFFTICLYIAMLFVIPLSKYIDGDYTIFGIYYGDYFAYGLTIYTLGIAAYLIGYTMLQPAPYLADVNQQPKDHTSFNKYYYAIAALFALLVIWGLYSSGVNVISLVTDNSTIDRFEIDKKGSLGNYLIFFTDSTIVWLLIGFVAGKKTKNNRLNHTLYLIAAIIIFLVSGFRYRIVLTFIGLAYIYFWNARISLKSVFLTVLTIFTFNYIFLFISYNRYLFYNFDFDKIEYKMDVINKVTENKGNYFFYQLGNFSTDFLVLKKIDGGMQPHDFGYTMFMGTLNRFLPAVLYEGGVKPKVPQLEIIRNSFGNTEGFTAGKAVSNIFEYYIAFGIAGVVVFMLLLGFGVKYVERYPVTSEMGRIIQLIAIILIFQIVTRGFTPQIVNHLLYFAIPFYIYKKLVTA